MVEKIDTSKLGIFIIDMQKPFLNDIVEEERKKIILAQQEILEICKRKDYPVIIFEYTEQGRTIPELMKQIKSVPRHQFLKKSHADGFTDNPLLERNLRKQGIENLCVGGVYADCCVLETIKGATQRGLRVITSEELISTVPSCFNYARTMLSKNEMTTYIPYTQLIQKIK
jgi:nicotinamidase-related amidase